MNIEPGYEPLADVLQAALDQAQSGKGKERHANDLPFSEQSILVITRMVGPGYPVGQAIKKARESLGLPIKRAQAELLGAINYLAAQYISLQEEADVVEALRPADEIFEAELGYLEDEHVVHPPSGPRNPPKIPNDRPRG